MKRLIFLAVGFVGAFLLVGWCAGCPATYPNHDMKVDPDVSQQEKR